MRARHLIKRFFSQNNVTQSQSNTPVKVYQSLFHISEWTLSFSPSLPLPISLSRSLSLSHSRAHQCTRARTHARALLLCAHFLPWQNFIFSTWRIDIRYASADCQQLPTCVGDVCVCADSHQRYTPIHTHTHLSAHTNTPHS